VLLVAINTSGNLADSNNGVFHLIRRDGFAATGYRTFGACAAETAGLKRIASCSDWQS
jgi:hypothetical protein